MALSGELSTGYGVLFNRADLYFKIKAIIRHPFWIFRLEILKFNSLARSQNIPQACVMNKYIEKRYVVAMQLSNFEIKDLPLATFSLDAIDGCDSGAGSQVLAG